MEPWKEKQRFSDRMITLILLVPLLVSLYIGYIYRSSTSLIIVLSIFALVALLVALLKLEVVIDEKGISYRYFPFHTSLRIIPWDNIRECKLIKVNALTDFGGLGIRYTSNKRGYIINSKYGLEIKQRDNKIIVVSITRKEDAEAALRNFRSQA